MVGFRRILLAIAAVAVAEAAAFAAPPAKTAKTLWLYPKPLAQEVKPPTLVRVAPILADYGYDSVVTSLALLASHGQPVVPIIAATYEFGFSTLLSPVLVPKIAKSMYGEIAQLKNNPRLVQIASLPEVDRLELLTFSQLEFSQKVPTIIPPVGLDSRTYVFVETHDGKPPPGAGWIRYDAKKTRVRFHFILDGDPNAMRSWEPTLQDLYRGRAMPEKIRKQWEGAIRKWEKDQSPLDRYVLHRPDLKALKIQVDLKQRGKLLQLGQYMSGAQIREFLGMTFFKRIFHRAKSFIFRSSRARKVKVETLKVTPDSTARGCLVTALRRRLLGKISPR